MRFHKFCCFVVLSPLISVPLHAAEPAWVKDSAKGCLILNPNPQPNETATWSGNCVGGKAEGPGEVVWYFDGIPRQTEKLTGENGVTMVAGKVTSTVSPNDVRFELASCDQGISGYRAVNAFVKKDLALWYNVAIAIPVLNMAGNFAQASCPTKQGLDNITVHVYYESDQPQVSSMKTGAVNVNHQIRARSSNGKWGEFENIALRNWDEPQKQNYATLLAGRQADTHMRERSARETLEREQAENLDRIGREMDKEFDFAVKKYASGGLPVEAYAKQVFKHENRWAEERGLIHIDSFKKTDGQRRSEFGVDYYMLEYEAVVSFPKGTNHPCIKWSEGSFYQCFMSNSENASPSGQPVVVTGKLWFEKTEKGWRSRK